MQFGILRFVIVLAKILTFVTLLSFGIQFNAVVFRINNVTKWSNLVTATKAFLTANVLEYGID